MVSPGLSEGTIAVIVPSLVLHGREQFSRPPAGAKLMALMTSLGRLLRWTSNRATLVAVAVLLSLAAAACATRGGAADSAPAAPTATAVAGKVSAGFNATCTLVNGSPKLNVTYRVTADEEKRLVQVYLNVNGANVYDSGAIDEVSVTGSRVISTFLGSKNRVELVGLPQDGRSATARKTIECPGAKPGFRA